MVTWRTFAQTDVGRRREGNEDSYLCDEERGIYVVADGMGGHAAGEIASAESVAQISNIVGAKPEVMQAYLEAPSKKTEGDVRRLVNSAIGAATYMVYSLSTDDDSKKGMGTTISTMVVVGNVIFIGQVGDSRVYLFRQGQVYQLTEDHSYVNYQLKVGLITEEEAKFSPHKNIITRSVGRADHVEVDTFVFETQPGDRFLLSSDGLHDYAIEHSDLLPLATQGSLEDAAGDLIDWANEKGGKDNITVVLVERD